MSAQSSITQGLTCCRGGPVLQASGYKIDYDEWHEFVHQGALDYNKLLHPDPSLRDILCSIDM